MNLIKKLLNISSAAFLAVILGCASVPTCNQPEHAPSTTIPPRESFVKVLVKSDGSLVSTGSGVLIKHIQDKSYVFTAGHMCREGVTLSVLDIKEIEYEMFVVGRASEYDFCVLGTTTTKIPRKAAKISKHGAKPGEPVYNLAAPKGIFSKDMVLMLGGYYSGDIKIPIEKHSLSTYTIPSTGGSSGSPIYNTHGEVIGIISMKFVGFENVTLAIKYVDMLRMAMPLLQGDVLGTIEELSKSQPKLVLPPGLPMQ